MTPKKASTPVPGLVVLSMQQIEARTTSRPESGGAHTVSLGGACSSQCSHFPVDEASSQGFRTIDLITAERTSHAMAPSAFYDDPVGLRIICLVPRATFDEKRPSMCMS